VSLLETANRSGVQITQRGQRREVFIPDYPPVSQIRGRYPASTAHNIKLSKFRLPVDTFQFSDSYRDVMLLSSSSNKATTFGEWESREKTLEPQSCKAEHWRLELNKHIITNRIFWELVGGAHTQAFDPFQAKMEDYWRGRKKQELPLYIPPHPQPGSKPNTCVPRYISL
jgi:hypothetical protein